MTFITANCADTDEMSHSAVSHLGLHDFFIPHCINGLMGCMLLCRLFLEAQCVRQNNPDTFQSDRRKNDQISTKYTSMRHRLQRSILVFKIILAYFKY